MIRIQLVHLFCASLTYFGGTWSAQAGHKFDRQALKASAIAESLQPIRPGIPGKKPFWNDHAPHFKWAPVFNFPAVTDAQSYRFEVKSGQETLTFTAQNPWADLSPVWQKVPVGETTVSVLGLNKESQPLGSPQSRKFIRSAIFQGPYGDTDPESYAKAAARALRTIFNLPHVQYWKDHGKPDPSYDLYAYPSKSIGAVMDAMWAFQSLPESAPDREQAVVIATRAADYLISICEPVDAALAFFPPTYAGEKLAAKEFNGQLMLSQAAEAGTSFLNTFQLTGEVRFRDAAKKIGDTLLKRQSSEGTWHLRYFLKDATPASPQLCVPTKVIDFLERLATDLKVPAYSSAAERALSWIENNPAKTYDWSAQFEDIKPHPPYVNLSRSEASEYSRRLFSKNKAADRERAIELLRFCEDQFVIWEPLPGVNAIAPCALEQFQWHKAIDESTASMTRLYLAAYRATKDELHLAKAMSLANTLVNAQERLGDGRIPTYLDLKSNEYWLNCMVSSATSLLELSGALSSH